MISGTGRLTDRITTIQCQGNDWYIKSINIYYICYWVIMSDYLQIMSSHVPIFGLLFKENQPAPRLSYKLDERMIKFDSFTKSYK